MRMIILLQSVKMKVDRLFWHISYYKVWQSNFITICDKLLLQSASGVTKCDRLLLQSASGVTKCDRLLLQSASGITEWHVTPAQYPPLNNQSLAFLE